MDAVFEVGDRVVGPVPRSGVPVVRLDAVSKRYGDVVAVRDVTLEVGPGEFFSILGPSGCGKTTTLRLIAGFEEPAGGRVLVDGRDMARVPPHRRPVNTVFQHYALFPHLSVLDNVAFGPRSRRLPEPQVRTIVRGALEVVRLEGMERRTPRELSGGEQQRVALARALVNRPRALLLDEPLGALDLKLREAMQLELKRIQREVGIAFLYVTHDQDEALRLSDRLAVMAAGRIEQTGTPEQVYGRPASVFVAGFIGSANLLRARVAGRAAGIAHLELAGGAVVAGADGGGFGPGDHVVAVVRPERVRVVPAGEAGLRGTIVDRLFEGGSVRVVVRTPSGDVHARVDPAGLPAGEVGVSWAPEDAYLLRDSSEGDAR